MKITNALKFTGLMLLVLSFAVGCAAPQPEEAPAAGDAEAAMEAINAAKAALKRAEDEGYAWRDTGKLIKQAEKAYEAGNYQEAIDLANEARRQSELAIEQKYREMERVRPMLDTEVGAATPVEEGARMSEYTVQRGDTLWDISAKPQVYENPYMWPLIYKANQDIIRDADLIFPGQRLDIDQNPGQAEADAAIRHARTRGAWTLGEVEASDRAYLAQ